MERNRGGIAAGYFYPTKYLMGKNWVICNKDRDVSTMKIRAVKYIPRCHVLFYSCEGRERKIEAFAEISVIEIKRAC